MRRSLTNLLLPFLTASLGAVAGCSAIATEEEACDQLLNAARRHHLAAQPASSGHYACAPTSSHAQSYFQFGLHYAVDGLPPDWVGSDLVGWYAVRRSDGRVFEWNIAEDELGPPLTD